MAENELNSFTASNPHHRSVSKQGLSGLLGGGYHKNEYHVSNIHERCPVHLEVSDKWRIIKVLLGCSQGVLKVVSIVFDDFLGVFWVFSGYLGGDYTIIRTRERQKQGQ